MLKDVQAHNVSATPPENHNMWLSSIYVLVSTIVPVHLDWQLFRPVSGKSSIPKPMGLPQTIPPFSGCLNCRWVFRIVVLFFRFVLVFLTCYFVFEFVIVFYDLLCFVNCCCVFWFFFFFFWFAFAFVICYFVFRIGICFALLGHHSLQSAERKSFDYVRDFRAQSANHLIQFGTSEHRAHVCVCIYCIWDIKMVKYVY